MRVTPPFKKDEMRPSSVRDSGSVRAASNVRPLNSLAAESMDWRIWSHVSFDCWLSSAVLLICRTRPTANCAERRLPSAWSSAVSAGMLLRRAPSQGIAGTIHRINQSHAAAAIDHHHNGFGFEQARHGYHRWPGQHPQGDGQGNQSRQEKEDQEFARTGRLVIAPRKKADHHRHHRSQENQLLHRKRPFQGELLNGLGILRRGHARIPGSMTIAGVAARRRCASQKATAISTANNIISAINNHMASALGGAATFWVAG